MAYGDRLKRGTDTPMSLIDHLCLILENSHNAYTFRYRCKGQQIIIERQHDNSIVAYHSDDRDGSVTIDTSQPPFDKTLKFS